MSVAVNQHPATGDVNSQRQIGNEHDRLNQERQGALNAEFDAVD